MELYFLRHAIAAERGSQYLDDASRALTDEGAEKMKKGAQGMKIMQLGIDRIVSSPYVRARQTAQIAAKGIDFKNEIEFSEALTPHANFPDLARLLVRFPPDARALLVGHEPSISGFVSVLISGEHNVQMDFQTGGLCRVDVDQLSPKIDSQLKWFLTSAQLRSLSESE